MFPLQTLIPLAALNSAKLPREVIIALLVFANLVNGMASVARVQLRDQLGQQMLVLGSFLDGGRVGARCFALPRRTVAILDGRLVLGPRIELIADLLLQQM